MRRIILLLVCVAGCMDWSARAFAQDPGAPSQVVVPPMPGAVQGIVPPTVDEITRQLGLARGAAVPDTERIASLEQALVVLEQVAVSQQRQADFERMAAEAPGLLAGLRAELAVPPDGQPPVAPPDVTVRQLENELAQAEANRQAAQKTLDELTVEAQRRSDRGAVIAAEVAQRTQRVAEHVEQLSVLGVDDARALLLRAQIAAEYAETRALDAERAAYDARRDLMPLRRDRAQRQLERARLLAESWQDLLTTKRQEEATAVAEQALLRRRQITAEFPELAALARRNEELATQRSGPEGIAARIDEARRALSRAVAQKAELDARFKATRKKIALGGLTEGMGLLLRREYEWIPDPSQLRARSADRRQRLSVAQLDQIMLQEERDEAGDTAARLAEFLGARAAADGTLPAGYEPLVRELLDAQRPLIETTIEDLGTLIGILFEHEQVHREQLPTAQAYRTYISERILWVRSTVGGYVPDVAAAAQAAAWLFDPAAWMKVPMRLVAGLGQRPLAVLGVLLVLIVLVAMGPRARRRIAASVDQVRSFRTDRFRHTLQSLLATVWQALPLPIVMWAGAGLLDDLPEEHAQARAVGAGLYSMAMVVFALDVLRLILRKGGLGEVHFRWPEGTVAGVRTDLRWLMLLVLPLRFLAVTLDAYGAPEAVDSLGRMAFVGSTGAVTVFLYRLLRPSTGHMMERGQREPTSFMGRTLPLWFLVVVGICGSLVVLALLGYHYTASQLELRLRDSIGLALLVLIVNALLVRWLYVARRKLAVELARSRAQARAEAAAGAADGASADESGGAREFSAADEETVDIPAIDAQTRQLFRSGITVSAALGLYLIWAGTLPALRGLDRIQLLPHLAYVSPAEPSLDELRAVSSGLAANGASTSSSGGAASPAATSEANGATKTPTAMVPGLLSSAGDAAPSEPEATVVTLADAGIMLLVLVLTFVAVRNIPGLMEMAVLQHLPMDVGERYAVSTMIRYLLLILGASASFSAIGVGWSEVQWLAAALTFGLAFGLQEIFANFVSGIIILLERPVRVGDIVTVGDVEGRVTRLRMRALTVLDWNRREMLIPNKDFITGRVINWTLTDPVTRVVIRLGIAYGSDTKRARNILLEIARAHPLVLADPAPTALFQEFGESMLKFSLRVFIGTRDVFPQVVDNLHSQIDDAFRAAGIDIGFPRRDLHIRSVDGMAELGDRIVAGLRGRDEEPAPPA